MRIWRHDGGTGEATERKPSYGAVRGGCRSDAVRVPVFPEIFLEGNCCWWREGLMTENLSVGL